MKDLEKEVAELRKENEQLKAENQRLSRLNSNILYENRGLKEEINRDRKAPVKIDYLGFNNKPEPTLLINREHIKLGRPDSDTVKLLATLFKTKTITRMNCESVPIDKLHNLLYGNDTEGEWFSLTKDKREKAKAHIRGLIRNINNEAKIALKGENLFVPENNGFRLSQKVPF